MRDSYAARWDAREDWKSLDYEWIGEAADGIWMAMHPEAALLEHPDLWEIADEFRVGLRDVTREDWTEKSSFEFDAKMAMASAFARSQVNKDGESRSTDRR